MQKTYHDLNSAREGPSRDCKLSASRLTCRHVSDETSACGASTTREIGRERRERPSQPIRRAKLGASEVLALVLGLDKPLYSLLFPNASIVAKASCRDVENAVVGIKSTADLHWVKPFGLVDNDASGSQRLADLRGKGVIPLNLYSVESVYYHPEVQKLAAQKLVAVVGGDLKDKLDRARIDAIKAIGESAKHLSERIAEKAARAEVFTLLPKKGDVGAGGKRTVEIDFAKYAQGELDRIHALISASDFIGVIQRYPIRESAALDAIAKALGCVNRAQYEEAVRLFLIQDSAAVELVRGLLGSFPPDLIP